MFSNKKWHNFCLLSMMLQWFDEAKRHHQVKAMGKPRAAREMHILQTSTFLSFLATGEPHVRPCGGVWGLKLYSSYSDCSQLWDVLPVGQPEQQDCVVLLSWCLQKGHWKGLCIWGGVSPAAEWETNGLVFLCTDFHGCHQTLPYPPVLLMSSMLV